MQKTEKRTSPPVKLKAAALKFLLKLGAYKDSRSDISALSPSAKTTATKRDRICKALAAKDLIEYDTEIFRFALTPPGRVLLTLQTTSLPVTPDELKVLRGCKGSMTLEKLGNRVPPGSGQQIVSRLVSRKLLKITQHRITDVRLTQRGKTFLQAADLRRSAAKGVVF